MTTQEKTLRDRVADDTTMATDLKAELLALIDDARDMAMVLKVYVDKRNWRREYHNATGRYCWQFVNDKFYFGQEGMEPEQLAERIHRTVTSP